MDTNQTGGPRPGDYSAPGMSGSAPPPPPSSAPPQPPPPSQPSHTVVRTPVQPQGPPRGTPPPEGLPPLPRRGEMKKPRGGFWKTVLVALISAIIGAGLVMLLMPWAFGVNPIDIIKGRVKSGSKVVVTGNNSNSKEARVVSPSTGGTSVTDIVKALAGTVVNIDIRANPQGNPFFQTGPVQGSGSGVVYTKDGYIITNNHVIQNATDIKVSLASGTELTGKTVGADPESDIAVVKVERDDLPTIPMGNSDDLQVGELVVAVGSPFGFEQSVTTGIVSALHRNVPAQSQVPGQGGVLLTDLIQTDAAINPGNSGGALVDSQGKLIGINTLIATAAGGSEGVGFAIPINSARRIADDIIAGKPVSHPYIGVQGQTIDSDIAKRYNLPVQEGAYVTNVIPGGPAAKAGIKKGDIIIDIDGKAVTSMDDVISQVRKHAVGDKLSVTYYQGEQKKTAEVTLEEKPKTTG